MNAERQPHPDHDALHRDAGAIAARSRSPRRADPAGRRSSTTSAASDDAVAPARSHRDPDVGGRERRRVVQTVADHDRRRRASRSASTASTFSSGARSDRIRSTPRAAPTDSATSGWSPVTITTRSMPDRRSARITRGVSGRIGSSITERAGDLAVDADEHARGAVQRRASTDLAGPARQRARPRHERRAFPSATFRPSTDAGDPRAVPLRHVLGERRGRSSAVARGADDRRREHVRRTPGRARRPAAAARRRRSSPNDLDVGDLRDPGRSACRSCRTAGSCRGRASPAPRRP